MTKHVEDIPGRHLASGRWRDERFLAIGSDDDGGSSSVDTHAPLDVDRFVRLLLYQLCNVSFDDARFTIILHMCDIA